MNNQLTAKLNLLINTNITYTKKINKASFIKNYLVILSKYIYIYISTDNLFQFIS